MAKDANRSVLNELQPTTVKGELQLEYPMQLHGQEVTCDDVAQAIKTPFPYSETLIRPDDNRQVWIAHVRPGKYPGVYVLQFA